MTLNHRFLVTAANGDLGEAVGCVLRQHYPTSEVHGVDASGQWPGALTFETMHCIPRAGDPGYLDALCEVVDRLQITLVIVCNDHEIYQLATNGDAAKRLPRLGIEDQLAIIFCDKLETANWLARCGEIGPKTVLLRDAESEDLPLIVKPRWGAGSTAVQLVESSQHLEGLKRGLRGDYVAQNFVPDDSCEFTCALVRIKGEVRHLTLRRRLDGGRTVAAVVEHHDTIASLLERIAVAAELEGVINVQLRMPENIPFIFEINPRFSSTVKMRHELGFNDLVWAIDARDGISLPQIKIEAGISVYRLSREVVVDAKSVAHGNE